MVIKLLAAILLTVMAIVFMGCPKECISTSHSFSKTVSFFPKDSILKMGDTLWLTSTFSCDSMLNEVTQKTEDYCDALINSTLSVQIFQVDIKSAVDSFTYIESKGKCLSVADADPKRVKNLYYLYENKKYEIKIGLVANKKGRYMLGVGNGLFTNKKDAAQCQKASLNLKIENFDTHIYILRDFLYPKPVTYSDIESIYCFIVK